MSSIEREFSDNLKILTDTDSYKLLCAFSGGVDSLALLILAVKTLGRDRVVPLYVNHNLRDKDELEKEIALNKSNCEKLGVELKIKTVERGLIEAKAKKLGGTESSARNFRYSFLRQSASEYGCSYIATAHHLDDQLETVLMKIISKGPVTSLRGIGERYGNIIRPLLDLRKEELELYVRNQGFLWTTDSTNNDNTIKRNELRNIVIPELYRTMPDWENRVLRLRKYAVKECTGTFDFSDKIAISYLKKLSDAQKLMALYVLWDNVMEEDENVSMPQTLAVRVIEKLSEKFAVISSNGGTFCIYNGYLYLVGNDSEKKYRIFKTGLNATCGMTPLFDGFVVIANEGKKTDLQIDFGKFNGKPHIRYVREGDSIRLKDGKKTVLRLLQDQKIPPVLRYKVPVIADDEEICAVLGTAVGGKDRICVKMRSALAPFGLYVYFMNSNKGI